MATERTSLTPHIVCRNAEEAAEFYQKAFGAELLWLHKFPTGQVMHGALSIDGARFFLVDEFPELNCSGPMTLGGTPVTLHLEVTDCDTAFDKALEAGCAVVMPLQDVFSGDRYGIVNDPYGHSWSIATNIRQVDPAEIEKMVANQEMCTGFDQPE